MFRKNIYKAFKYAGYTRKTMVLVEGNPRLPYLPQGQPALLRMVSLNSSRKYSYHMIVWTGKKILDPTNKGNRYVTNGKGRVVDMWWVISR